MSTDHVLKLYSKTIQSSFLHYGFWDHPENIDLCTLSLQDIKNAQYRYIDHLASFIPSETKTILDLMINNRYFDLYEQFSEICIKSKKWEKWLIKNSKATDTEKVIISGHYLFSDFKGKEIIKQLNIRLKKKNINLKY